MSWAWKSNGASATMTPVSPPITKTASDPAVHSIGTDDTTRPARAVAMKQKNWTPVGMATAVDAA